jgi:hypothetical protein
MPRRPRTPPAPTPPPAPTKAVHLGSFEGQDVIGASVAITNAGDGLSQALATEPDELHLQDVVYVVLECVVSKVRFEPVKDTNALRRIHTLKTLTATTAAQDLVEDILDEQREKNRLAALQAKAERDTKRGTPQLPGVAPDGSASNVVEGNFPEADPTADPAADADVELGPDGEPL